MTETYYFLFLIVVCAIAWELARIEEHLKEIADKMTEDDE